MNGDGCSSNWDLVEDGWIWTDSTNELSECSKIAYFNEEMQHRNLEDVSEDQVFTRAFVFSIIGVGALFNFISCLISEASYQSIFSSFNYLQLLLLIPLTSVYLPKRPEVFIFSIKPALLTFFSISWDDLGFVRNSFSEWDYPQNNPGLFEIGLEQGSIIVQDI